jgi:cytochrome c oxidase subunit 4
MTGAAHEPKLHFRSFIALLALLAATFALAHVKLGAVGLAVALAIAAAKAGIVLLYFMQLRRADGMHRIAAALGVFWLGILMSLTLSDYVSRDWLGLPGPWPRERPGARR